MKAFTTTALGVAIASLLFVGCNKAPTKPPSFHDPLIRQQLTTMLSDLHSDRAVPRATRDLSALISVNSARFDGDQLRELTAARDKLRGMQKNLDEERAMQGRPDYTDEMNNASWREYRLLFTGAKAHIEKAAATF